MNVMKRLLADDRVSADLPVSVLKLHRDATIVIDRELYEKATR